MRLPVFIWLCFALALNASAQIIPSGRVIDWSLTGHQGGIPTDRTNISINVKTTLISSNLCAGDGITDDATHLRNALLAFGDPGGVIYLPPGTYRVTTPVPMPNYKQGWTIRGAGQGQTIILCDFPSSTDFLQLNGSAGTYTTANLIGPMLKGTTNAVLDTVITGTLTHRLMLIDQLNDGLIVTSRGAQDIGVTNSWTGDFHGAPGAGLRSKAQIVQVTSISNGTNLTFWPPLYVTMNTNLSPQANVFDAALADGGIGIEDMTMVNKTNTHNFIVANVQDSSWIKNVEFQNSASAPILVNDSLFFEGRDCYQNGGAANADCSFYLQLCNGFKFENNIFKTGGFIFNGCAGGVVSYNLFTNFSTAPGFLAGPVNLNHGAHSYMNLFEGNVSGGYFQADSYWGSSGLNTFFRNRILGTEAGMTSNLKCLAFDRNSLSNNVVGNVLGSPAVSWTGYEANPAATYPYTDSFIYRLGYPFPGNNGYAGAFTDTTQPDNYDPRVSASILRTNNFDYANNAVVNPYAGTLPASLIYTNGAPSWWTVGKRWPAIDTAASPMVVNIPAQDTFSALITPPRYFPWRR